MQPDTNNPRDLSLQQEHQIVRLQAEKAIICANFALLYAEALVNGKAKEFVQSVRAGPLHDSLGEFGQSASAGPLHDLFAPLLGSG